MDPPKTKWFNDGNGLPRAALEIIEGYFRRVNRPLYLGYVSLEVRYSLAQTKAMLDHLVERGVIRELTDAEKRDMKFDARGAIYVLNK